MCILPLENPQHSLKQLTVHTVQILQKRGTAYANCRNICTVVNRRILLSMNCLRRK